MDSKLIARPYEDGFEIGARFRQSASVADGRYWPEAFTEQRRKTLRRKPDTAPPTLSNLLSPEP